MHSDLHALPVRLLACDSFDMHHVFESVDRGNGAFTAFVRAAYDGDFVVFADGDGADLGFGEGVVLAFETREEEACLAVRRILMETYLVLVSQFFVQRGGHDDSADAGWGAEVRLARLPP